MLGAPPVPCPVPPPAVGVVFVPLPATGVIVAALTVVGVVKFEPAPPQPHRRSKEAIASEGTINREVLLYKLVSRNGKRD